MPVTEKGMRGQRCPRPPHPSECRGGIPVSCRPQSAEEHKQITFIRRLLCALDIAWAFGGLAGRWLASHEWRQGGAVYGDLERCPQTLWLEDPDGLIPFPHRGETESSLLVWP